MDMDPIPAHADADVFVPWPRMRQWYQDAEKYRADLHADWTMLLLLNGMALIFRRSFAKDDPAAASVNTYLLHIDDDDRDKALWDVPPECWENRRSNGIAEAMLALGLERPKGSAHSSFEYVLHAASNLGAVSYPFYLDTTFLFSQRKVRVPDPILSLWKARAAMWERQRQRRCV